MTYPTRLLAWLLALSLATVVGAQPADEAIEPPHIEPEALSILRAMADQLTSVDVFGYRVESNYDAVQDSGLTVEYGTSRKVLVSRPNRLRMESQRRDGTAATLVFDGDDMWIYVPEHRAYATMTQPGDLDEAIDFAVTRLRIKAPLPGLVSPDFYAIAIADLTRAYDLGESVVAGVTCDHLLLSNDYADFQMWITTGEQPVLRRIVITYREEHGQPQYRAQFLEWNLAPGDVADEFRFEPPDNAERIRFHMDAPAADPVTEEAS